jgi:hypothetical protein
MADSWELVLHHSYRGTPGVIFDESPRRECHGVAVNMDRSAFSEDGAEAGSGSVSFPQSDSRIRVPAKPDAWKRSTPIRMEFVCRVDDSAGGMLFGSGNFLELAIDQGAVVAHVLDFGFVAEFSTAGSGVEVPTGSWVTVAFEYDGLTELELSVDGAPVHVTQKFAPVTPLNQDFFIGSDFKGGNVFRGSIDDAKIWRLNRNYIGNNFGSRPVDDPVIDCWHEWSRRAWELLHDDPDCAKEVLALMQAAVHSVLQAGLLGGDASRNRWLSSMEEYRQHWAAGDLSSVRGVLNDLDQLLKQLHLDAEHNPAVKALLDNRCFKKIADILGPPHCDPEFIDIFRVDDAQGRS